VVVEPSAVEVDVVTPSVEVEESLKVDERAADQE